MIKNIIFDFGNVLGTFDFNKLMKACGEIPTEKLQEFIFYDWNRLDEGLISYEDYIQNCLKLAPPYYHKAITNFFTKWYKLLPPIEEIHDWIKELKQQGFSIYLLSNAPVIFEKHASSYPILECFDGIVFSGSIQLVKPQKEIYIYLLEKYHLNPQECFFIDDKEENIEAGKDCGIDGMVYANNLKEIKAYIQQKGL